MLAYNGIELTVPCLESIPGATGRLKVETILVDNGSKDGTAETVAAKFPWVRLVRNDHNGGFTLQPGITVASGGVGVADFDHDGDVDMVAADFIRSLATVLLNDGTGQFAAGPVVPTGYQTGRCTGADFGKDALPEIVTANARAGSISFGVLLRPMSEGLGWSRTVVTAAASFQTVANLFVSPVVGVIVDRWGPRLLMVFGASVATVAYLLLSRISEPWQFYLLYVVAAAFGLTRLVESMLFGVSPTDPATFVAVGLLLAIVAAAASYIPARRAARVDPMISVRQE